MLRRLALLLLILSLALLPSRSPAAHPASGYQVSTVSQGIKLTLIVPHKTYPRNGLARVTITARDVARRPVRIMGVDTLCGSNNPYIDVSDGQGHLSQLPTFTRFLPNTCPLPAPTSFRSLGAGRSLRWHRYVILTDSVVEATIILGQPPGSRQVSTPAIAVRLTGGQAPQVELHRDRGSVFADIQPVGAMRGPLRYIESVRCPFIGPAIGYQVVTEYSWQVADGEQVTASCDPVSEWYVIAGWLNQPVAHIDYVKHRGTDEAGTSRSASLPRASSEPFARGRAVDPPVRTVW
jgi:hypothetical protein